MSMKGINEKLYSICPETSGGEDIGLSVKFKNAVTGKTRELMLLPPVNITMWHAAAMNFTAALPF